MLDEGGRFCRTCSAISCARWGTFTFFPERASAAAVEKKEVDMPHSPENGTRVHFSSASGMPLRSQYLRISASIACCSSSNIAGIITGRRGGACRAQGWWDGGDEAGQPRRRES